MQFEIPNGATSHSQSFCGGSQFPCSEAVGRIRQLWAIDPPIVVAEIVEYNPRCDISGMTATVAAKFAKEIGAMMLKVG